MPRTAPRRGVRIHDVSDSRPRRSALYMPAANERALEKAKILAADSIIFDLEDAVAPDAKESARVAACTAAASGHYGRRELTIRADDPLSARYRIVQSHDLKREGWDIHVETDSTLSATKDTFTLTGRLDAYENGTRVASRNWHETFPRTIA